MSVAQQRALVAQPDPTRPVQARCQALGLSRSSFYYQPCGESAYNLHLMRLLDEEFTDHNFKGVLGLRDHLRLAGHAVNEKRVRRLVRLIDLLTCVFQVVNGFEVSQSRAQFDGFVQPQFISHAVFNS